MDTQEIDIWDFSRILVGEVPWAFYLEVVFRTIFLYLLLMVTMRANGKKIVSQAGQSEMIMSVALAAAVGIPLQSPERGLLPALLIAAVVLLIQKVVAWGIMSSQKFERITQDSLSTLVKDGICQLQVMKKSRITPERLRAQLRTSGIRHLGEVKRMYLETNGAFTLMRSEQASAGLCILPGWDLEFRKRVCQFTDRWVCSHCGKVEEEDEIGPDICKNCGWEVFERAVK